jgi:prepilin-type N-terminal cleavage/methylation domain-containing protein
LVEILVVMVIIGVVAAGALLSLGVLGRSDRELERERDRL